MASTPSEPGGRASEFFSPRFFRAADVGSDEPELTIARWGREEFQGEPKLVLFFTTGRQGLVVNKTNLKKIADWYGDDLSAWVGKKIVLFVEEVFFQGRSVDSIRVRKPAAAKSAGAK